MYNVGLLMDRSIDGSITFIVSYTKNNGWVTETVNYFYIYHLLFGFNFNWF